MSDINTAFAAAVAKHHAGDFDVAEQMYRAILSQAGAHAPTLCNLGVLLVRAGKLDEAEQKYQLALATISGYPDAHFNLGNLYRRSNQFALAATHYRECLNGNPQHASAAYNFGLVYAAVGDMHAAVEMFRAVVRLEPGNADAYGRLGDAHVRCGQLNEGIAAFRKGVDLKPSDPRGLYNLGLALSNAGKSAEATECIQKALKLKPDYAEAHNALGLNLEFQGRKDDALFHYQKAVELKPDLADAWSNLGTNLAEQGRCEEAINCLRESLTHRSDTPAIHSNLLLLLNYSSDLKPLDVAKEHFEWATKFATPVPDPLPLPHPHESTRKMRVGYISSDYRNHTVANFIELLLTHHDRNRVEVYAYASILRPDDTTEKLRKLADHWRPIGGLPDGQAYEMIRKDQLDVLIELNGHTAGNRLTLLAQRPAPIQLTLFGYPNTTGMAAVDYRITDAVSDPVGTTEELSVERLLRLPEVPWAYVPPDLNIPVTPLPSSEKKQFTFGCLNNSAKISDACLNTWIKLIQSIPGTKLMLLAGQSQAGSKRLMDRFTKAGILRERIEMVMRLPREKYFEAYQQFDISLDPFPYNGGVTTGDSLWMGVPVLTVAGPSYVSRQGVMVNTTLGLNDFTADSPETLIALAKSWTQRRPELAEIRANLRQRLLASALADGPRYVRNLEAALRDVWEQRM